MVVSSLGLTDDWTRARQDCELYTALYTVHCYTALYRSDTLNLWRY